MAIDFKYMLIGFGPEVYFAVNSGISIFTTNIAVLITVILSFDTPASMSSKYVTVSVTQNPTLMYIIQINTIVINVQVYKYFITILLKK